jgi:hypothetical protein
MRLLSLALLLGASVLGAAQEADEFDVPLKDTIFDGKTVPAMKELTADTFPTEISKSTYTVVKFYRYGTPLITIPVSFVRDDVHSALTLILYF